MHQLKDLPLAGLIPFYSGRHRPRDVGAECSEYPAALAQEFLSLRQRGLLIVSGTHALVKKNPEARGKLLPSIVSLFAERLERGPRLKDHDAVLHEDIQLPIFEPESGSVHAKILSCE